MAPWAVRILKAGTFRTGQGPMLRCRLFTRLRVVFVLRMPGNCGVCAGTSTKRQQVNEMCMPGINGVCAGLFTRLRVVFVLCMPGISGMCAGTSTKRQRVNEMRMPGISGVCAGLFTRLRVVLVLRRVSKKNGSRATSPANPIAQRRTSRFDTTDFVPKLGSRSCTQ
jgi:hypothetical protein